MGRPARRAARDALPGPGESDICPGDGVPGSDVLLMLGNQVMYQKFFSAKSEKDARISVVGWIVGTVVLETLIVAIAVIGSALYRTGEVAQATVRDHSLHSAARPARAHGRAAAGGGLREGYLHRIQLSVFAGHQPDRTTFLCATSRRALRTSGS